MVLDQEQRSEVTGIIDGNQRVVDGLTKRIKEKDDILADLKEAIDRQQHAIDFLQSDSALIELTVKNNLKIEEILTEQFNKLRAQMDQVQEQVTTQGVLLAFQTDLLEAKRTELEYLREESYSANDELLPIMNRYELERANQIFQSVGWPMLLPPADAAE